MKKTNSKVTITVPVPGVKKSLKKLKRLKRHLKKANSLVSELALKNLELSIRT